MPELPEVETVVQSLSEKIVGSKLENIKFTEKGVSSLDQNDPEFVNTALSGSKIRGIKRYGKFIVFEFTGNYNVVNHLRMTGRFVYVSNENEKFLTPSYLITDKSKPKLSEIDPYIRIKIKLDQGYLYFSDKRRFGTFHIVESHLDYPGIKRLGPDATSRDFNIDYLASELSNRTKPIYSALLDQSIVAGLGNIYVCESLAATKIHPFKKSKNLSKQELENLIDNIKRILNEAIKLEGTSVSDFQNPDAATGGYQEKLIVYGKTQTSIEGNKYKVEKTKISGRSAYFIPDFQKLKD